MDKPKRTRTTSEMLATGRDHLLYPEKSFFRRRSSAWARVSTWPKAVGRAGQGEFALLCTAALNHRGEQKPSWGDPWDDAKHGHGEATPPW